MSRLGDALVAGITGFRKSYFNSSDVLSWSDFKARTSRYGINWAYYDNTAYDDVHSFATNLKNRYSLYKSVRSIASPATTIVAHFRDHVWGGVLDAKAGDKGAIPIFTENESLGEMIADIWKYSQWSKNKNLMVTKGAVFGDIGLRVIDDVQRNKVYLEILDPMLVKDITLDPFGNVRDYVLEYDIPSPDKVAQTITYREEVSRDGDFVVYKTFLNNEPHAYADNVDRSGTPRATWGEPYGFTPLVWVNHISTGEKYGWSELYPGMSIFREVDDQVSLLSDQIRKTIQPFWLFKGTKKKDMEFPSSSATAQTPEPWRQEQNMMFASNPDVSVEAMLAKLDIEGAIEHIKQLTETLEKQYPELVLHKLRTEGAVLSGRALRIAQMPAEARVIERRNNYDAALKNALQMAMSILGFRGIYKGINLESYDKGTLDFEISEREVFELDPEDKATMTHKFFQAAKLAVESGIPVDGFLRSEGWTEEEITEIMTGTAAPVNMQQVSTDELDGN